MLSDEIHHKIQHIIRGTIIEGQNDTCTAVRNHLSASFSTSRVVKKDFEGQSVIKEEQVIALRAYALEHRLWLTDTISIGAYLTHGGEAEVYLTHDQKNVVKLNDGVYYATWLEYLNSLVLHNMFFPDTAYTLLGFTETRGKLVAVVQQSYIIADGLADVEDIRQLLAFNGFEKTRREDYFNAVYGLILEDMHDENVLTRYDVLFFIDTVFYTVAVEI